MLIIRPAVVDDIPSMARVHVNSWRQAHRGIAPDALLDDPDLLRRREEFWLAALTDERWSQNRVAVAARDGALVGVAMSGPPLDDDATWDWQLYLVYVDHAHHGAGVGGGLLDAVLTSHESVALWVATRNVQAQTFYRRHGFRPDGHERTEGGIPVIRWSRPADPGRPWRPSTSHRAHDQQNDPGGEGGVDDEPSAMNSRRVLPRGQQAGRSSDIRRWGQS